MSFCAGVFKIVFCGSSLLHLLVLAIVNTVFSLSESFLRLFLELHVGSWMGHEGVTKLKNIFTSSIRKCLLQYDRLKFYEVCQRECGFTVSSPRRRTAIIPSPVGPNPFWVSVAHSEERYSEIS